VKKTFLKIIFDEIKSSFGRFAAIFSIVALSIGFLSGLLVSTPDMRATADIYYDENNTADIFIKATKGLTKKDIDAVSNLRGVKEIMPAYVIDSLLNVNNEVLTAKIFGLPILKNGNNLINNLQIISGRMPLNEKECVVEKSWGTISEIEIGSKLTISKENEDYENIVDTYNVLEYTVVGIVENPFYFSVESERSSIGNGTANALVYVDESCFSMSVYTDFFIKINDSEKYMAFTDEYENYVENYVEKLKTIGIEQSLIRISDIKNEAYKELNEGKKEYEDSKEEAETELSDAAIKIADGKRKLIDASLEIKDGKIKLQDARETLKKETDDAITKINDGYEKISEAKIELDDGELKYAEGIVDLENGQIEYTDGLMKFLDSEKELSEAQAEFNRGEQEYLDGIKEIEEGKEKIKEGSKKLSNAKSMLIDAENQYEAGVRELNNQTEQFNALIDQIINILNPSGLTFASREDFFNSLQNDETGMVKAAVTLVLTNMRDAVSQQISILQNQNIDLQNSIANLELLIENINNGSIVLEEGQSLENYQSQLNTLKEQQQILQSNINALQGNLQGLPQNSESLLYSYNALKQGEEKLVESSVQITNGWEKYYEGRDKLNDAKEQIKEAERELEKAKEEIEENRIKLKDAWVELEDGRLELQEASLELKDGLLEAEDARKELDEGWAEYNDGLIELADAEKTLKDEIAIAEIKIKDGEIDLANGQKDYNKGITEIKDNEIKYLDAKKEAEIKLADASVELFDAEKEINNLQTPEWYVLDRNSNVSYASFSANAGKVSDVAKVFPVFFFLIAALVTLTTMTRMVEEERTQIGTLKALGYRKSTIISKYIIYSGLASTLGCVAGILIGFRLLPSVIWNAYRSMYHLPNLTNQMLWRYALPEAFIIILLTVAVTYNVCSSSLKEKPATLMLPKAPKAGKRIFLERIDFIWSRMKFSYKSTARNIMRYKKHLIMTVVGIGGCTALMLTGFGLLDSIGSIANTQFIELYKYDLNVGLEDVEEYDSILNEFLNDKNKVEDYAKIYTENGYVYNKNEKISTTIKVAEHSNELAKVINLRDRSSENEIEFNDSSVIMTEKLAEIMGLKVGDIFTLENSDSKTAEFVLTNTTENYVGCYIYINKNDYAEFYKKDIEYNTLLVNTTEEKSQEEYISELLTSDSVMNVEPVTQIKKSFDSLLSNIEYIVVVIILASGTLAVIVLYNLTNININERRKELSTLKVLGYHNEEVASYVFRETTILSVIGTIVGLPLGTWLHTFVIQTVEAVNLMMGRSISFKSYIYSVIITLIFAMLVNLIMYRKLRKIEMVESMKAID